MTSESIAKSNGARAALSSTLGIALLTALPAFAQEQGHYLAETDLLEEVVVTATRREESLQDIPMAVTVLSGTLLERMGALEFMDYATSVPNLSFGAVYEGVFTSRGVQIRGIAGRGTTGFYIDEIPIPESMNPRVIDIERIEVLRGPQGSLYGAGNMGGTVRMITKRADPELTEARAHAFAGSVFEGNWDWGVDAAVNLPMGDSAAFRGSVYWLEDTGIYDYTFDNPSIPGDEFSLSNLDDGNARGLQALVTWNVTQDFSVEPRVMYQKTHLDWLPFADNDPENFENRRLAFVEEPNEEEWTITSLTLRWDTRWGSFISATGYFDRTTNQREDSTEVTNFQVGLLGGDPSYVGPAPIMARREFEQFTQEFRFTSDFEGRLQFIGGLFYSDREVYDFWPPNAPPGFDAATPIPFGRDMIFTRDSTDTVEERAVFGEFEWAVTDRLFLTAGGRFFDNSLESSLFVDGILVSGPGPAPPRLELETEEDGFNPKFAVEWRPRDDWSLYGTAARGYRLGGTNPPTPETLCDGELAAIGTVPGEGFDSDSLWSYEIGSKSTLAGGGLNLNVSTFRIDWQDLQQAFQLQCGYFFNLNTGVARSQGFEVELAGRVGERFSYQLGIGYTDAEIRDPEAAAGVVRRGDPLPQVPEWTFAANGEWRFDIGDNDAYLFVNYRWVDESVSVNQGLDKPRIREAYNLLDARLGLFLGQNWNISLYGSNLTNDHVNLSDSYSLAAEDPRRPRYVTNRPRTIGVDVRWVY